MTSDAPRKLMVTRTMRGERDTPVRPFAAFVAVTYCAVCGDEMSPAAWPSHYRTKLHRSNCRCSRPLSAGPPWHVADCPSYSRRRAAEAAAPVSPPDPRAVGRA